MRLSVTRQGFVDMLRKNRKVDHARRFRDRGTPSTAVVSGYCFGRRRLSAHSIMVRREREREKLTENAVDVGFADHLAQRSCNIRRRDIFRLPPERVAESVGKVPQSVRIATEKVARPEIRVALLQDVVQDLLLRRSRVVVIASEALSEGNRAVNVCEQAC